MSGIYVHGIGAVSPAGWGVPAMRASLESGIPPAPEKIPRPGWEKPLSIRGVPAPASRPAFLGHPRLRRASPITQFSVAAACEACGAESKNPAADASRLGVIVCMLAGSIAYTRRFYEEVLRNPATASPLIFPETVFNAPASHLAAYLGANAVNYTLVGDEGAFLQALALAAHWLEEGCVEACLVVGAEEIDWIIADAINLFDRQAVHSAGAGALLLKKGDGDGALAELAAVTDSFSYTQTQSQPDAARRMRAQLPVAGADDLLCHSVQNSGRAGRSETAAWSDWSGARLGAKTILGEGLGAASAWQCVAACDLIGRQKYGAANVSVVGASQQAIGARFVTARPGAKP